MSRKKKEECAKIESAVEQLDQCLGVFEQILKGPSGFEWNTALSITPKLRGLVASAKHTLNVQKQFIQEIQRREENEQGQ